MACLSYLLCLPCQTGLLYLTYLHWARVDGMHENVSNREFFTLITLAPSGLLRYFFTAELLHSPDSSLVFFGGGEQICLNNLSLQFTNMS
jgi:hypothetical protein